MLYRINRLLLMFVLCINFIACESLDEVVKYDSSRFIEFAKKIDAVDFYWGRVQNNEVNLYRISCKDNKDNKDNKINDFELSDVLILDSVYIKFMSNIFAIKKDKGLIFFLESEAFSGYAKGVLYAPQDYVDYHGLKKLKKLEIGIYAFEGYIIPM